MHFFIVDYMQGNPEASLEDPGVKARIFMHDCSHGYYGFVTDIGEDVQCDSGFSMKTISSMEEYEEERKSSSNTAFSAKVNKLCIFRDIFDGDI